MSAESASPEDAPRTRCRKTETRNKQDVDRQPNRRNEMTKVEIEIKAEQGSEGESTCGIVFKVTTLGEIGENATLDLTLYTREVAMALIVEQWLKTEIPRIVAKTNRGRKANAKGGAK
jgi:hypothetical protein